MSVSNIVLIGLGLCMVIVPVICILAARKFFRLNGQVSEAEADVKMEDEVLELGLDQLSFDQLAQSTGQQGLGQQGLGDVECGLKPERVVVDILKPRLESQLGLLNKGSATLITVRLTSDIVIYRSDEHQAVRPHGPTMRQDTIARLAPGEQIAIAAQWDLPEGFLAEISGEDSKGVYLLARVRFLGANLAPGTRYFLLGHLLPSAQLVPIRNSPEALENLGLVNARTQ